MITLTIVALFVPAFIIIKRNSVSEKPPFHIVPDMDYQPFFKAQNVNPIFEDQRAARPQVEGTVAAW
ncbi:MAG: hypothetical protein R3C11_05245 [Planctomycetaceae bacterium]